MAELNRQLKRNYDARGDYWTAGDFHYGEMETKRLSLPAVPAGLAASLARGRSRMWLHQRLGLVAWYRRASQYGESYTRPAIWLAAMLVLFGLLYPLCGLTPRAMGPVVSYANPFRAGFWQAWFVPWSKGLLTAAEVACFQRYFFYTPDTPMGHALRVFELPVVSTLIALLLLALRRQFKP